MKLNKKKLETIKNALQYAVLNAKTESEESEFVFLLVEIESEIKKENQKKPIENSLDGCPFKYCDKSPNCLGNCRYNNNQS